MTDQQKLEVKTIAINKWQEFGTSYLLADHIMMGLIFGEYQNNVHLDISEIVAISVLATTNLTKNVTTRVVTENSSLPSLSIYL